MSYKVDETKLIAYLYDELSAEEKHLVEEYLEQNEAARNELEALKETQFLMHKINDHEVEVPKFTFDQSEVVVTSDHTHHGWWKYPMGIAASIALVLFIGYLTSMRVSNGADGLSLSFGEVTESEELFTKAEVKDLIAEALKVNNELVSQQIKTAQSQTLKQVTHSDPAKVDEALLNTYMAKLRDFNREALRSMLENSEQNQKSYTDQSLRDLAVFLDIQRENDLNLIQTRFENFEVDAEYNHLQTNQILTNLMSSVEEQQPSNQY